MNKLVINFSKHGRAFSDFLAENHVKECYSMIEAGRVVITTSTSNVVEATRACIAEGIIDYSRVDIQFEDKSLELTSGGRIKAWPNGFCDHTIDWLSRIL